MKRTPAVAAVPVWLVIATLTVAVGPLLLSSSDAMAQAGPEERESGEKRGIEIGLDPEAELDELPPEPELEPGMEDEWEEDWLPPTPPPEDLRSTEQLRREVERERHRLEELRQEELLEDVGAREREVKELERRIQAKEERLRRLEARMPRDRVIRDRSHDVIILDHRGSVIRMGQDVEVESGESVEEVVVIAGDLSVFGEVIGDAVAIGGNLDVHPGARVGGDAVAVAGQLDIHPGAMVEGDQVEVGHFGPIFMGRLFAGPGIDLPRRGFSFVGGILTLLVILFIGWLAVLLFGDRLSAMASLAQQEFGRSFLFGLLIIVLWAPAMILSTITVVGIPVAILLILIVPLALFVGYLIGAMAFGRRIASGIHFERSSALAHLLTGLVAIGVLTLLADLFGFVRILGPLSLAFRLVSAVIICVASLVGLGALTVTLSRARSRAATPPPGSAVPEPPPQTGGGTPPQTTGEAPAGGAG